MSELNKLFVPSKIKVGYQNRNDTYTGKLAYIIYFDNKGVLRKEKSWEGWRDKKIEPVEFDNIPTSGFVLNKKVGGYQSYYNYRNAYVRVYDPRGFEFEIQVPNLLYILSNADCSKGKGLEGEFVYSWDGTDLILLPVNTPDYQACAQYTKMQDSKVSAKTLVVGSVYESKKREQFLYLGRFKLARNGQTLFEVEGQSHIFVPYPKIDNWHGLIDVQQNIQSRLSHVALESVPDFAEIMQKFTNSLWMQDIVDIQYNDGYTEYAKTHHYSKNFKSVSRVDDIMVIDEYTATYQKALGYYGYGSNNLTSVLKIPIFDFTKQFVNKFEVQLFSNTEVTAVCSLNPSTYGISKETTDKNNYDRKPLKLILANGDVYTWSPSIETNTTKRKES